MPLPRFISKPVLPHLFDKLPPSSDSSSMDYVGAEHEPETNDERDANHKSSFAVGSD
jgi:hypothetical protein